MRELNRIILLIVTMIIISLIVVGMAIFLLYRTAFNEERTRLVETAQSQARLIEAIARHDGKYSVDYPGGAEKATLDQIKDAHASYEGFGETGEFILARRVGDEIVFLLRHRHTDLEIPKPVSFESELAKPMRLALSEMSGTVIGLDYRGAKVLAAYEPVGILNLGIVAKIDLVEIRSPFIRAGLITLGFAVLVIVLGAMLFFRITNPMIRKLTESEERLSSFMESATDGFVLLDSEMNYIDINKSALEMTGTDRKTFIGKNILDVVQDIKKSGRYDEYKKVIKTGNPLHFSDITPHIKFGMMHTEVKAFKVGDGLGMIFTDITERKQAEEELENIFNLSPDMVAVFTTDGKLLKVNPSWEKVLGYTQKELLDIGWSALVHPDDVERTNKEVEKQLKGSSVVNFINRYKCKDGSYKTIEWQATFAKEGIVYATARDITERKIAEEALQREKGMLAKAQQIAHIGSWTWDIDTDMVVWSDELYKIHGLDREKDGDSLTAKLIQQMTHPDDMERGLQNAENALKEFRVKPIEYRIIRPDGTVRTVYGESEFKMDLEYEKPTRMMGIVQDITELKRADEALRESEQRLNFHINNSPLASVEWDSDFIVTRWAGEAEKIFGWSPDETNGKQIMDLHMIYDEDIPIVQKTMERLTDGTSKYVVSTNRNYTKDGKVIYCEWYNSVLFNTQGKMISVMSQVLDISERKKAEEALRESEEKYRQLFENSSDAVMIFDDQTRRFEDANKATLELYGYTREEFLKLRVTDLSVEPDKTKIAVDEIANGETGSIVVPVRKHKKKDRTVFMTEISAGAFISKGRKKIIGEIRDITERIKAEEEKERLQAQLVQSEKMAGIGTLTSGIAHEFNNLLQIMSGHTEFAQRTKKPEDMEEALEIVGNTSDRVSKIIKDLLTFSRREPLERKPGHVSELIDFVLSMTEEQLKKNNITVVREYGRVPKIEVNMGEIQQVFLNLVTNARDAMSPKGGKLEIGIKKVRDNVEVSVTDTGAGIEKENLSRVFEPFYTTKGAVGGDTRIQGIGLGLSVSYGIVRRHGGTIEVESEAGKGTTFTIRLPAKVEKAKERVVKEKRKVVAEKTKPMNVLVVDDEEEICKMFTKWLSAEDHNVKSSTTGKKALDLVKKESFDIVFLDIIMPGIPAIDTLAEIQEISPKTKIFLITGKLVDKELWKELKAKGASGYLQKPFKIENIKNCLAKIKD